MVRFIPHLMCKTSNTKHESVASEPPVEEEPKYIVFTKYMARNKNKYRQQPCVVGLPLHVIEKIIDRCDPFTRGRCAIMSKAFHEFVGDARPRYLIHQHYFLELIEECCTQKFFYLRIFTSKYHVIISDENGAVVYIDIIPRKSFRGKTLKRSYRIAHALGALRSLLNGTRIFKGTDQIARVFFRDLFQDVDDISMSTDEPPNVFMQWRKFITQDVRPV